jgi:hypothetical protein
MPTKVGGAVRLESRLRSLERFATPGVCSTCRGKGEFVVQYAHDGVITTPPPPGAGCPECGECTLITVNYVTYASIDVPGGLDEP